MTNKTENEIIYYRESLIQSFLADLTTFSFLLFSSWINYRFIGSSKFVYGVILIMFLLFVTAKTSNKAKRFNSKQALSEYLSK